MDDSPLSTEAQRRKAVAMVLALTANTHLAPQRYELDLLTRFEQGELTIEQVEEQMDARVHQLLYHSQEKRRLGDSEMQALLEWSRRYNGENGITGLLLHSEGRFVQVLEGSEAGVHDLFARIQRDTRHELVKVMSQGLGPRLYGDWSMDYDLVPIVEVEKTIIAVQTKWPWVTPPITHPRLTALLATFA